MNDSKNFIEITDPVKFQLPQDFPPMCLKILDEFIKYHKLPNELPRPSGEQKKNKEIMERIFYPMILSLSNEKRDELLKEAHEYYMSFPFALR